MVLFRGKGDYYRLGHGNDSHIRKPQVIEGLKDNKVVDLAVGALHCLAVTDQGQVTIQENTFKLSPLIGFSAHTSCKFSKQKYIPETWTSVKYAHFTNLLLKSEYKLDIDRVEYASLLLRSSLANS